MTNRSCCSNRPEGRSTFRDGEIRKGSRTAAAHTLPLRRASVFAGGLSLRLVDDLFGERGIGQCVPSLAFRVRQSRQSISWNVNTDPFE